MTSAEQTPKHPYIAQKEDFAGGKPVIEGTRIKVSQIVIEHEHMGWTADEIVTAHPHLAMAQVYDALSYYFDHLEEINREIRESEEFDREMRKKYPHSALEEKRSGASNLLG